MLAAAMRLPAQRCGDATSVLMAEAPAGRVTKNVVLRCTESVDSQFGID
jgi:hypothetical protein